ncbi:MAG TPA: mercuric transport protein MerTP [Bacteroidetes bacterium]|nr:mercuric transport protein MerTP [Bacteroidota bacterium]
METNKTSARTIITGIIAALGASLCCITPLIAAIGGLGGFASSFAWLEPFRPWLIGFTILVFGFAWYQKLRPRPKSVTCDCDEPEKKTPFIQTKSFLAAMTIFAAIMLAFPYYSGVFFPDNQQAVTLSADSYVIEAELSIQGMTCTGCENHVNHALQGNEGVINATSSYEAGKAIVKFDQSKVDLNTLSQAVETATGYTVTDKRITKK